MEYKLFEIKSNIFKGKSGIYLIRIKNRYYIGSSIEISARLADHKQRLTSGKHSNPIIGACFNKYGKDECYVSILEEVNKSNLLIREKHYIDILRPELNCELDPTTQNNCITTSKVVYQFNLDGSFITEFCSAKEAGRQLNINPSSISAAARLDNKASKYKSAGGFLWSYIKEVPVYQNNSSKAKVRKITMFGENNLKIRSFDSISDAARFVVKDYQNFESIVAAISACCRNHFVYEVNNYHFSYKDLASLKRKKGKRKSHMGT